MLVTAVLHTPFFYSGSKLNFRGSRAMGCSCFEVLVVPLLPEPCYLNVKHVQGTHGHGNTSKVMGNRKKKIQKSLKVREIVRGG